MTEFRLDVLVEEQLESVVFVRDYLQLDFVTHVLPPTSGQL
ncbi:hypothetical protein [Micromonospora sp. NPDC048063]